jgi:type VI secretion system secreted protein VgrG
MATVQDLQYTFVTGQYEREDLRVLRFSGVEGVSSLFEFQIEIGVAEHDLEFEDRIGEEATFTWVTGSGDRSVHGIVSKWEEIGRGKKQTRYVATLVPRLWMLSLRRQSRIFQNKNTPDIVKAVLEEGGIPSGQYKLSLHGTYKPRTYCVQYRESDLDFVMRLLEEEGMFFWFEQKETAHTLIIADRNDATVPIEGDDQISFREEDTGMGGAEHVSELRLGRSLRVGAVSLKEFDFKKPHLDLKAEAEGESSKEKAFKSYDYPGEYHALELGKDLAKIRLEEERAERLLGVGRSDCRRFIPGYRFTLVEHARDTFNQEYLLLRVRHRGRQPQGEAATSESGPLYSNAFECIPATTPYRAPRVTPRPTIEGPQNAVVVGPVGEEIHCDNHGRIKVHFPWDRLGKRNDTASCWIRVSQSSGGAGWGSMVIPRIGQEVVVTFLEGDPDRPLVTGRLYNGERPTPYGLPGQNMMTAIQSNTSPGGGSGNEVRFNDSRGNQEFFMNASKDHHLMVANDSAQHVVANEREQVGATRMRDVGGIESITVTHDRAENVGGMVLWQMKKDHNVHITGASTHTVGTLLMRLIKGESKRTLNADDGLSIGAVKLLGVKGDSTQEAGKDGLLATAATMHAVKGDHQDEIDGDYSSTVGGLILRKAKDKISVEGEASMTILTALCKIKAEDVKMKADDLVALVGGSSSIVMTGSSVTMVGAKVDGNSDGAFKLKGSIVKAN